MAEKDNKTEARKAEDAIKARAAKVTDHKESDFQAYAATDVDYLNYSSVARKPFEAGAESETKDETKTEAPQAPKAPSK